MFQNTNDINELDFGDEFFRKLQEIFVMKQKELGSLLKLDKSAISRYSNNRRPILKKRKIEIIKRLEEIIFDNKNLELEYEKVKNQLKSIEQLLSEKKELGRLLLNDSIRILNEK